MKRQSWLIVLTVVLITALPLWLVDKPSDGEPIFGGADSKAQRLITVISPGYQPWFAPILEPASSEIASLLFALQAALGAGFIGYWLGVSVTREKYRREAEGRPVLPPKTPVAGDEDRRAD